mmetsp:Transcript_10640/g.13860  ORF Transcript_10640/g.13860 Transcript_10640/m.13860 type:complete len:83 (+) Transcript_10640:121-369(+)
MRLSSSISKYLYEKSLDSTVFCGSQRWRRYHLIDLFYLVQFRLIILISMIMPVYQMERTACDLSDSLTTLFAHCLYYSWIGK